MSTVTHLIGKLFCGTLSDNSPLQPQLTEMKQKAMLIGSLGHKISKPLLAIVMLHLLPASNQTLRTIMFSMDTDKLTVETIVSKTHEEERGCKHSESLTALAAKTGGKSAKKKGQHNKGNGNKDANGSQKSKDKCSICGRLGHTKEICFKLKAALDESKANGEQKGAPQSTKSVGDLSAKVAQVKSNDEETLYVFVSLAECSTQRNTLVSCYIIDSGASAPMSSQQDWFKTYQPLFTPRKVWLGDNHFILAQGIGQIELNVIGTDRRTHRILI